MAERHRPADHPALHTPHRLRHRSRGVEALHADDARPGRRSCPTCARSTWAAASRWGGCPRSRRSTWPTWARTCATSSWPSSRGTAGASRLEIEPGTYLVANAGAVVATCIDVVDTGREGYLFAKLDTGMTEVTRPSLYGAQHPIDVLAERAGGGRGRLRRPVLRVGRHPHAGAGRPRGARPRGGCRAPRSATWWSSSGAGAYCAAMSTINYNSYPQRPRGDAGAGRHAAPAPAPPGAGRRLGRRGLTRVTPRLFDGSPKASSRSSA